jgi:hypothetical protein
MPKLVFRGCKTDMTHPTYTDKTDFLVDIPKIFTDTEKISYKYPVYPIPVNMYYDKNDNQKYIFNRRVIREYDDD